MSVPLVYVDGKSDVKAAEWSCHTLLRSAGRLAATWRREGHGGEGRRGRGE